MDARVYRRRSGESVLLLGLNGSLCWTVCGAAPLSYQFKETPEPVYEVIIQTELPQSVQVVSGRIFYAVKSVDPTNGQITLGRTTQFRETTLAKDSDASPGLPVKTTPPAVSVPYPTPQSAPDVLIDANGKALRSSRSNAMRIIFMRRTGSGLDVKDTYESDWLGYTGAGTKHVLAGKGERVIGTFGRQGMNLNKLGLITLPAANQLPSQQL